MNLMGKKFMEINKEKAKKLTDEEKKTYYTSLQEK